MLHPVGSHAPAVYWRRRVVLAAAVFFLLVLTAWVLRPGGGDGKPAAAAPVAASTGVPAPTTSARASSSAPTSSSAAGAATTAGRHSGAHSSVSAVPKPCQAAALEVAAVAGAPSYRVGDQPVVMLQVTNSGTTACVQDLADAQVELRVYNGESRVWGSHDCLVQQGTDLRTLAAGQTVRISVTWSGLSSQPGCAGTRQRVGAGTYTLYGSLAGRQGSAAQFSIS